MYLILPHHGLTVPLTSSLVDSLRKMVQSLTAGDFEGLSRALAEAGLQLGEGVDIATLLQLVGVLLGNEEASDTTETMNVGVQLGKSLGSISVDLLW